MEILIIIIIIVIALLGSAFISASEAAVIAVNKVRIKHLSDGGNKRATAIVKTLEENEKFFGTLLLLGNLLNVLIATLVGTLVINIFGKGNIYSVISATIISTIIVVTFGELTPKSISTRVADRWSIFAIQYIRAIMYLVGPAAWAFTIIPKFITKSLLKSDKLENPAVTTGELRSLIDIGEEEGTVESSQGEMLENIFRFSETEIKDIMTPRPEIIWIQSETSIKNFLKIYKKNPHTRFPVCDGQLDNVIGIINVKDVMLSLISPEIDDSKSINTLCKETMFSPEMKLLDELLEEFQVSGHKITLAIDEYGDISGILTLSRCIEKIVGEAAEEGKKLVKKISKAGNDTYVVEGGIAIDEINNELKIKIPEGRYETLAGFIIDRMQTFPSKKSRTNFRGFRFTVMDMEKNKISKIQIKVPLQNIKKNVR